MWPRPRVMRPIFGPAGQLFAGLGRLGDAETQMVTAISLNAPDEVKANLRLSLARLYVLQNQHALARLEANEALSYFSRRAEVEPDNHGIRLAWAEAALFLGRIMFFIATSIIAYVYAWRKGVFRWD